jgi:hypothetical protein
MAGMQDKNERLTLLKEVVALGEEIETAFQNTVQRDFSGIELYDVPDEDLNDYFVYQFLHNVLTHAWSAVVLAENSFPKQLWLVARTTLEGWFFFKSFINKRSPGKADPIARKWRCYHIYQLYQLKRKSEGEAAAIQMLTDLEDHLGTDLVMQAEKQFDFQNEKEQWYKRGNLRALIDVDGDRSLLPFYERVYSIFSQVQHWDPTLVIATEIDADAALGVVIHNTYMMLLHVVDFYDLAFDDQLKDIYRRFIPLLFREVFPIRS